MCLPQGHAITSKSSLVLGVEDIMIQSVKNNYEINHPYLTTPKVLLYLAYGPANKTKSRLMRGLQDVVVYEVNKSKRGK